MKRHKNKQIIFRVPKKLKSCRKLSKKLLPGTKKNKKPPVNFYNQSEKNKNGDQNHEYISNQEKTQNTNFEWEFWILPKP